MRKFFIIIALLLAGRVSAAQTDLLEQACLGGSLAMVKYHTALLDKTLAENADKIECLVYKIEKEILVVKDKQKREVKSLRFNSIKKAALFYVAILLTALDLHVYGDVDYDKLRMAPQELLGYYFAARGIICLSQAAFPTILFPETVYQVKINALTAIKEHLQALVFLK